jgi:DNA-binding transcriptional ArsR family regulator
MFMAHTSLLPDVMQTPVQIAQALADETRLHILTLLLAGAASVSDLVTRLGLPQPRVSTHLALLRQAGLVSVQMVGRQRVYRADAPRVQALLEALGAGTLALPRRSPQAGRQVRRNTALRQGRTCYDHLAGVAGVQLLEELLRRGWIASDASAQGTQWHYGLTAQGTQALTAHGVDVTRARQARRRFAYGCLDWTERRAHLGGALGAAVLEALQGAGIVQRQPQTRALILRQPLTDWLEEGVT